MLKTVIPKVFSGGPLDWLKWSANPYKISIFCSLRTTKLLQVVRIGTTGLIDGDDKY
jgi:hypothetical protein